ncbi:MAG: class II aldolase/adducin family protein [Deltaproteobacteria bacterium]|nr:class II aldolase/adducin family protein [Deltaproteobacteria bacterium]
MRPTEPQLRQNLTRYGRRLWERGWVANHDGNLSLRLPRGRVLCSPTGISKADLSTEMALVVDGETGKKLSGELRPFSELNLHLAFYACREDAQAVVHAHPPLATAYGAAGIELPHPFLPEAVVSLGASIPTVPLALPGQGAADAIAPYLPDHHALLIAGNGVLTCGADLEQAYLRMELVEHLCTVAHAACALGGVQKLSSATIEALLAAHVKAGLAPRLREVETKGRSQKLRTQSSEAQNSEAQSSEELQNLVNQEIARVLGR